MRDRLINCGHHPEQFIPGATKIPALRQDEDANAKTYAESQKQRGLERALRAARLKVEVEKAAAKEIAAKLDSCVVKIEAGAGSDDRLYGAVTSKDVVEALKAQHGIALDKRKVSMDPIKTPGKFTPQVKLYTDISAVIHVHVIKK